MINFNSLCYPTLHEICRLASHDNWCWNLYCGTCGHQEFIKALLIHIHVTPYINGDNKTYLIADAILTLVEQIYSVLCCDLS